MLVLFKPKFIPFFTQLDILQQLACPTARSPLEPLMQAGVTWGAAASAVPRTGGGFYVTRSFRSGAPSR